MLIAADCTAYAYGAFHRDFIRGRVVLVGCPKLDEGDYTDKLTEIFRRNDVRSVTVARMEVPCCGGIQRAGVLHMVRQPQAADQLFAPGLVGEHPVNHRAQQRPFIQRGPARHPQHAPGYCASTAGSALSTVCRFLSG